MKFTNNDVFVGNWINGVRIGNGKMIYSNGDNYEGNWNYNIREGKGKINYINVNKFNGEWVNDIIIYGNMEYLNGDIYFGN